MRIQSEDGTHFIELLPQEVGPPCYPSLCVQIEGSAYDFSAIVNHVWLRADDMHVFLTELVRLEQLREGSASLASMNPDDAALSLQTVDRAGHMIATLDLTQHTYTISSSVMQRLSLAFEIDVSLLPQVVRQFRQLIPPG